MQHAPRFESALSATIGIVLFTPIVAQAALSDIDQITIYQGMASVTRSLPVQADAMSKSGEQILVFSCLSPNLDAKSVSIQATAGINVGEVSIEPLSAEQAKSCQYQGNQAVRSQQQVLDNINADLDAAELAKAYLQNLTKVLQVDVYNSAGESTIGNSATTLEQQASRINRRLLQLTQQQAQAQDALNQLMAGNSKSVNNRVTQVSVRTASRGNGEVKLHYQVRGAGWEPTYQARLNTKSEQLVITASAVIAQHTGENWLNVPITLSTVNPNQQTSSELPDVTRLSLFEKEDANQRRVVALPMAEPAIVMDRSAKFSGTSADTNQAPLPSFQVDANHKNGITEYRLPQRVSLPSDGRRVSTVIDEQTGKSKLWIRSSPEVETKAYWYASAPFLTPAWADGSLQVYRDDNYIGQSYYAYQTLKEQGIGFGVDRNMMVKKLSDEMEASDNGVFKRTKQSKVDRAYQFSNLHKRAVDLEVLGSEPISQNKALKVDITHTPPIAESNWQDNQGIIAWRFNLAPKQTQVVQTQYTLSYPADKELR